MSTRNELLQPGITRKTIEEWQRLRQEDADAWNRELMDRPARYDGTYWRRAVRTWRNNVAASERHESGRLWGVPFLVKDLFDVSGEITGCSSRVILEGAVRGAAEEDASLVARFRDLGAHFVGHTQMNEFAYGLDGKNAYTGDCPHPLDAHRIPGGSSSGSAWAVAAGIVPVALGTDTGGSVRVPAALSGIYGYRMARDTATTAGVFPLARSFDTAGWFTADADDMQIVLNEIIPGFQQGPSAADRGAGAERPARFWYYLPPGVELDGAYARAIEGWLERIQTRSRDTIQVEQAPETWAARADRAMKDSLDAYNIIGSREAWIVHREWLDRYRDLYTPVVWSLIDRGRHWSEERVAGAREVMEKMQDLIGEALWTVSGMLIPATPVVSPKNTEAGAEFREQTLRLNTPGSMAGTPVLSVPIHLDAVRSGGVQVLVPAGEERRLQPVLDALGRNQTRAHARGPAHEHKRSGTNGNRG